MNFDKNKIRAKHHQCLRADNLSNELTYHYELAGIKDTAMPKHKASIKGATLATRKAMYLIQDIRAGRDVIIA